MEFSLKASRLTHDIELLTGNIEVRDTVAIIREPFSILRRIKEYKIVHLSLAVL